MINRLLEKNISRIVSWNLYLVFPFLLIFFVMVGNFIEKYSGLSRGWQIIFIVGPLILVLWWFSFVIYRFKEKQKTWLRQHGYKVYAKYKYILPVGATRIYYVFTQIPVGMGEKILVESFVGGKKRWFWSETIEENQVLWAKNLLKGGLVLKNGYTKGVLEKKVEVYIKKHPEGFEVFISTDNSHVYWVNTIGLRVLTTKGNSI